MLPFHQSGAVSWTAGSTFLDWGQTCAGQNRILLVSVSLIGIAVNDPAFNPTVTYNGVTVPFYGYDVGTGNPGNVALYVMYNPPIGTFRVHVTYHINMEMTGLSDCFSNTLGFSDFKSVSYRGVLTSEAELTQPLNSSSLSYSIYSFGNPSIPTTTDNLLTSVNNGSGGPIALSTISNSTRSGSLTSKFTPSSPSYGVLLSMVLSGIPVANSLSLWFGPTIPKALDNVGLSFITGPALKANNSIVTLNASRYAPENWNTVIDLEVFNQGQKGSNLNVSMQIPGSTFNNTVSGFSGYSLTDTVQLTSNTWSFQALNTPINVSDIEITKAGTWFPTIHPGTVYRLYTVPNTEPASSWLITSGLNIGDQVILIYSVPELQYSKTIDTNSVFPPSPARYKQLKQIVSPISSNTFKFRGSIYQIDQILINGIDNSKGSLPWNGNGSNAYVHFIDNKLQTVQIFDTIQADDYIEITYHDYNDFYTYSGYKDIKGTWYPFDANPEYGHWIGNDVTGQLMASSDALSQNCMLYAIPSAYLSIQYQALVPPASTSLGTLYLNLQRASEWGELSFIRHTVVGDNSTELLAVNPSNSYRSTWGQAQFGLNYYDQLGESASNIYSSLYPSMLPLGNVLLSAPASIGSVTSADIRQRGGGIPPNYLLTNSSTQSQLQTLTGFMDVGLWMGTPITQGGVTQIEINSGLLKTDPNNPDPNKFTATEINQIIQSQLTPGVDYKVIYV